MKIKSEILNILAKCEIKNSVVFLPNIMLDRKMYQDVNKCLEAIGGKWNRKEKGHVFSQDPTDLFDEMMISEEFTDEKKEYQFFPTPQPLARMMVEMADIQPDDVILEPSAGHGAIVDELPKANPVIIVELNEKNAAVLQSKGYEVTTGDFLTVRNITANKVIMNPPFSKQQDIDHILHAFELLTPGGTLVSIVSESPFFRDNSKSIGFRQFLHENNAEIIENDDGAFKSSGTMVRTRIVKVQKLA